MLCDSTLRTASGLSETHFMVHPLAVRNVTRGAYSWTHIIKGGGKDDTDMSDIMRCLSWGIHSG